MKKVGNILKKDPATFKANKKYSTMGIKKYHLFKEVGFKYLFFESAIWDKT